jgi:hypothetical protein
MTAALVQGKPVDRMYGETAVESALRDGGRRG